MKPILSRIFVDRRVWIVKYPEELFELGDFNVVNDDRMRSIVPKGNISIRVHVRLGEEHLGFPFEVVFVHTEEGVVNKDIEISSGEVVLMVSSDRQHKGMDVWFVSGDLEGICSSERGRHDEGERGKNEWKVKEKGES